VLLASAIALLLPLALFLNNRSCCCFVCASAAAVLVPSTFMHGAELLRPVLSMLTYQWRVLSAKTCSSSDVSLDDAHMVENVKKQLVWAESEGARQGTEGGRSSSVGSSYYY
jgi:hypothetical protein